MATKRQEVIARSKRKYLDLGRIQLPKGKTANERAKEGVTKYPGVLFLDEATIEVFDNAMLAAEAQLQTLLKRMKPEEIAARFARHLDVHLEAELEGATRYGNDCAAFCRAVNAGKETV